MRASNAGDVAVVGAEFTASVPLRGLRVRGVVASVCFYAVPTSNYFSPFAGASAEMVKIPKIVPVGVPESSIAHASSSSDGQPSATLVAEVPTALPMGASVATPVEPKGPPTTASTGLKYLLHLLAEEGALDLLLPLLGKEVQNLEGLGLI